MSKPLFRAWGACLLLSAAGLAAAAPKDASRAIEAKVALESSLEKRLQTVLRGAIGSDDLIVIVNATLMSADAEQDQQADSLPGVPPKQASDAVADSPALARPMLSRLTATIIMDESAEAKDVELVQKVASGILGITPARGDALAVEKIKFHKPVRQPDPLRYAALAASALWLIFAVLALAILQRRFLAPLVSNLRDLSSATLLRGQASEDREPRGDKEPAAQALLEAPQTTALALPSPTNGRPSAPFAFLTENDLPKLLHILRRSSDPVAATVIQYLPPPVAGKVMAELDPGLRRQVVSLLSTVSELDESQVRPLEDSIRKRIDYVIGGEDKVVDLLSSLPPSMQEELLKNLRSSDPALAESLGRRLVFLDDIADFEPAEIKLLCRQVPAKTLAVVLKASPALRDAVLPKLAAGTREWLTQEIDLSGELSPDVLEAARAPVLAVVNQLVREGKIVPRKRTVKPVSIPEILTPQDA